MDTVDIRLPQLPAVKLMLHEDGDPYISPCLRRWRIWEPRETRFVLDLLRPGQHVVDVGANLGYYTVLMSHLVGAEGKVFAFEPEAGNSALLQTNLALNQCANVVAERAAVADRNGTEMLSVSKMDKGDHRLGPAPSDREPHEVTTVSLDDYFRAFRTPVHFIKVDVQGTEPRVLDGMRDLIARNQHQLVCLLEFSPGLLTMANSSLFEPTSNSSPCSAA